MCRAAYALTIFAVMLSSCSDAVDPPAPDKDDTIDPPVVLAIDPVSGNAQDAPVGVELTMPLEVQVRDDATEANVSGARVDWLVESGSGTFRPAATTATTPQGTSLVYFTATSAGAVVAAVAGNDTARFRVFPPALAVYGNDSEGYLFYPDSGFVWISNGRRYPDRFSRSGAQIFVGVLGRGGVATLYADKLSVDFDFIAEMEGFSDGVFPLDRARSAAPDQFLAGIEVRTDNYIRQLLGSGQEGAEGTELPEPLVAELFNLVGPAAGVEVTWRVVNGAGTFRPSGTAVTDASGIASVYFTPSSAGAEIVVSTPGGASSSTVRTFGAPRAVYGDATQSYSFYSNGTFALRQAPGVWAGTFLRFGSSISLVFDGRSGASVQLGDNSIVVNHPFDNELDGFEDGTFALDVVKTPDPGW